jgi:hypothetical protein
MSLVQHTGRTSLHVSEPLLVGVTVERAVRFGRPADEMRPAL